MRLSHRLVRRRGTTAALVLLGVLTTASSAQAHGTRLPFEQWGGFAPALLRCQRELSRAAATCADTVWHLRRECREAALNGGSACDPDADQRRAVARRAALDAVEDACSSRDVGELGFLDISLDLPTDLRVFCYG
ncbi:MAG TPA: hypothetical protein VGC36_00605, partial [Rhizomicrobium sp.]